MHLFGKKRKVVLGQYLLLSAFLAGKSTHTRTRNLVALFITLGLELSLKSEHTAVEGQENNRKTHTRALLRFKELSIANMRLCYYE